MRSKRDWSALVFADGNLLLLLIALLFALMVTPVLEQVFHSRAIVYSGVTAVLVLGVFVNRRRRGLFVTTVVFSVLAISVTWSTLVVDHAILFVASCILESAFYAAIAVALLVSILRKHYATLQSIFGAVCVYLLLGLCWAQLYWATEQMDKESLTFNRRIAIGQTVEGEPVAAYSQLVYFSFVTMSTLGYGDIAPETPIAQTLAWMQSVTGQFYLAVLVAWLVSAIPRSARKR